MFKSPRSQDYFYVRDFRENHVTKSIQVNIAVTNKPNNKKVGLSAIHFVSNMRSPNHIRKYTSAPAKLRVKTMG